MSQDPVKTTEEIKQEQEEQTGSFQENTTKKIQEIQKQLREIDQTEGIKVQQMLNYAAAAHASPGGDDVKVEGKTEAEWLEEFEKASKAVGEKKAELEKQLNAAMQNAGRIESPEERKAKWLETVERANKAAQEPLKDLTAFAHPELDPIRSQLQNAPPKGQETSAVDDGTGGESQTETKGKRQAKSEKES